MAIDFSNMGVALGAGVDEWHRQQAEARAQQRAEQEQEQFGWQRQQYEQQRQQYEQQQALRAKKQAALDAFNAHQEYAAELDNIPDDKLGDYVQRGITQYNTNPYFKNGFFAKLTTVNGQPVVVHEDGVTRKAEHLPLSRDMIRQGLGVMDGMLRRHLTSMTPEDYLAESDRQDARGLKIRELGVHERNAATNEGYRKDQIDARREEIERRKNEVTYQQDGAGQLFALRDGKVVGTIGRPRPIQGGGGGGVDYSLSPAEQSKFADVLARYNAEQDPAKQAAIAREYQMLQSNALLMRGKVPNLPAAMFKGSPLDAWETPTKVKSIGKDGTEMERTIPLRLADPAGYAAAVRAQSYKVPGVLDKALGPQAQGVKPATDDTRSDFVRWAFPLK